jgi:hypothetical protein
MIQIKLGARQPPKEFAASCSTRFRGRTLRGWVAALVCAVGHRDPNQWGQLCQLPEVLDRGGPATASPDDSSHFHDLSVGLTDCCTLDQLSDRNASDFDALATATSRTSRL